MNKYPKQIEETSIRLSETAQAISELRERLGEIEAIETLEIVNAKTPEGKPQFSNESTRSAELVLRLRQNQGAAELKQALTQHEQQRSQMQARLERLRGDFKIALLERQADIAAKNSPFFSLN